MSTLMVCGSPKGSSPELLGELAANANQIIAVDSGANWLIAAGVVPDLLVGDLDSIDASVLANIRETDCRCVSVSAHKDFTDFDLALAEFGQNQGQDVPGRLIISNVLGGRIDHELGALGSLAKALVKWPQISALIIEDDCMATILTGETTPTGETTSTRGATLPLSNIASIDSTFSIVPLVAEAEVSATGVEWELEHAILPALGSRGVSNIVVSSDAQVTVHSGTVFVIAQVSHCR